jgi:hypothetical protein
VSDRKRHRINPAEAGMQDRGGVGKV